MDDNKSTTETTNASAEKSSASVAEGIGEAALANYDFIVMVDKSGSMSENDCPGGKSRWAYAQEQTEAIARKCNEYDTDGIDVFPFNNGVKELHGVTPDVVHKVFTENQPGGSTDTARALNAVFDAYFARKASGNAKPIIVVCLTDGIPDDEAAVAKVITGAANKLDNENEIGLTFIQVGNDKHAREFLKRLDDGLQSAGAKFDIVDTLNFEEMADMTITQILVEAVND